MKRYTFFIAIAAPAVAVSASFSLGDAAIVREREVTSTQKSAAAELACHLKLVCGRDVAEGFAPGRGLSFVFAKPAGATDAGPFEARYRIDGSRVWFWGDETGGYPGSRFAVYTFLSDELGIKWAFPGEKGVVFRPSPSIELPERKDVVYKPPFRLEKYRMSSARAYAIPHLPIMPDFLDADPVPPALRMTDAEISARCRAVGKWVDRMRLFSPDPIVYGHAFTKWQDRFEKTHPEYLALNKDGTRRAWSGPRAKLCVSCPGVVDQIIADWQAEGLPRYINICENDGAGFCVCENCRALDCDLPGEDFLAHKTDRYLNFWNRVAAKAKSIRPDVQVSTYIYSFYRHAPRRERVEYPDNLVFGTVPSLVDDYRAFFDSWKKAGMKQFFLRPNFHTYYGILPRGVEKDVYDVFQYGRAQGLVGVDFDAYLWRYVMGPESYVTGRMVAEPERTFDELMDEYCSAYGAAAKDVRTYYDRIRARHDANSVAANADVRKANVQDDSQFAFAQTRMHGEAELAEDLAVLEKARASRALSALEASRLDDMIVRARGYQLAFRLFKAASDPKNRDEIAAAARALIDYRIANRDAMMDHYEQVMNSRTKGTEGHLLKLVPEVLREHGGMTPRSGLGAYN